MNASVLHVDFVIKCSDTSVDSTSSCEEVLVIKDNGAPSPCLLVRVYLALHIVLTGRKGESLHDICTRSQEFHVKLANCKVVGVFKIEIKNKNYRSSHL
jgi:hypothetical protein